MKVQNNWLIATEISFSHNVIVNVIKQLVEEDLTRCIISAMICSTYKAEGLYSNAYVINPEET
jgi:hypothetical protein